MPERRLRLTPARLLLALGLATTAVLALGWPGRAADPGTVHVVGQESISASAKHSPKPGPSDSPSDLPSDQPTDLVVSPVITAFPTASPSAAPTPSDASPSPTLITTEVTASPVPIGGAGVDTLPTPTATAVTPQGGSSPGGLPWPFLAGGLVLFAMAAGAMIFAFSPRNREGRATATQPGMQFTPYGTETSTRRTTTGASTRVPGATRRATTTARHAPDAGGPKTYPLPRPPRSPKPPSGPKA